MTIHDLTPGMIHPSYIGMEVMLKPVPPKRKPQFIGWLYSEKEDTYCVNMPAKYKRKYKDHPGYVWWGGIYQFDKDGTMFVQEGEV